MKIGVILKRYQKALKGSFITEGRVLLHERVEFIIAQLNGYRVG